MRKIRRDLPYAVGLDSTVDVLTAEARKQGMAMSITVKRCAIQIAVSSACDEETPDVLFALADDGTLWKMNVWGDDLRWELLPPLPLPPQRAA